MSKRGLQKLHHCFSSFNKRMEKTELESYLSLSRDAHQKSQDVSISCEMCHLEFFTSKVKVPKIGNDFLLKSNLLFLNEMTNSGINLNLKCFERKQKDGITTCATRPLSHSYQATTSRTVCTNETTKQALKNTGLGQYFINWNVHSNCLESL